MPEICRFGPVRSHDADDRVCGFQRYSTYGAVTMGNSMKLARPGS